MHADNPANQRRTRETSTIASAAIRITLNGKPQAVPAGATVRDFPAGKKLADGMAIVERNGVIIPRAAYPETPLAEGDVLEVVHAVGGG